MSNIISLKVLDDEGKGSSADVLAGLQWVADNMDLYNIRIVNLSVGTADIGSFDPLVKAVERAWDLGLVIICAAGNNGPRDYSVTSPGISRKVITVGASDDNILAASILEGGNIDFSGRGPTSECIIKPDVLAPGSNIVSCLSNCMTGKNIIYHKDNILDENYMSLSGTSMAAPMVSGAAALLLEKDPALCPNEVKYKLKLCSTDLKYPQNQQGWGLLNIEGLISDSNFKQIIPEKSCEPTETSDTVIVTQSIKSMPKEIEYEETAIHPDGIYEMDEACLIARQKYPNNLFNFLSAAIMI